MTNGAFNTEIQFVDNTLAFNRLIFTQKLFNYFFEFVFDG